METVEWANLQAALPPVLADYPDTVFSRLTPFGFFSVSRHSVPFAAAVSALDLSTMESTHPVEDQDVCLTTAMGSPPICESGAQETQPR